MKLIFVLLSIVLFQTWPAQSQELKIVTVTRPPFSLQEAGNDIGFSMDLWAAVATDLGREYQITRAESFSEMLGLVQSGQADAAVANISITADREALMDFSQPIFESGLQIMVQNNGTPNASIIKLLLSPGLLKMIAISMAILFGAGMLMWRLERNTQPYFDKSAKDAAFPAFWWALNLVVNGGFEERPPTTILGRLFGILLVISSLFVVSIFVAKVTATLTIDAIQNNVNTINDLYNKRVGTIESSTASIFLDSRDLNYTGFGDLKKMFLEFENGELDAIIFDAPILIFYAKNPKNNAEMTGSMFRRENYGIALPTGSPLVEPINQSLLRIREDGTYEKIFRKWFGDTSNL